MERLAKEKIAKQQQIMLLRRQLAVRFDNIDSTIHLLDAEGNNGTRERGLFEQFNIKLIETTKQRRKMTYFRFSWRFMWISK